MGLHIVHIIGGFCCNGDFLAVFKVTLNYRLGAIGFMSLNLADYSGNMGLKDQVLAMKWIQANIKQFGGSENITILGHGSGMYTYI